MLKKIRHIEINFINYYSCGPKGFVIEINDQTFVDIELWHPYDLWTWDLICCYSNLHLFSNKGFASISYYELNKLKHNTRFIFSHAEAYSAIYITVIIFQQKQQCNSPFVFIKVMNFYDEELFQCRLLQPHTYITVFCEETKEEFKKTRGNVVLFTTTVQI